MFQQNAKYEKYKTIKELRFLYKMLDTDPLYETLWGPGPVREKKAELHAQIDARIADARHRQIEFASTPAEWMPKWDGSRYCFSALLAQTDLFRLSSRGATGADIKTRKLACPKGTSIRATGPVLSIRHMRTYATICSFFAGTKLGTKQRFAVGKLAQVCKLRRCGTANITVRECLRDLAAQTLDIETKYWTTNNVHLLEIEEDDDKNYVLVSLPRISGWLYVQRRRSNVNAKIQSNLSQFTARLYAYVGTSQKYWHCNTLSKLQEVFGYDGRSSDFKNALMKALGELRAAGEIGNFRFRHKGVIGWTRLNIPSSV